MTKQYISIVIMFGIIVLVGYYFFNQYKFPKVVYYAKIEKLSTSGETRFRLYDTNTKKVVDPDNQYSWFFAMPKNVPDDTTATDNWVKYLQENKDSVFKIIGTRSKDDCDYYGSDHCIQDIEVKIIQLDYNNS